MRCKVNTIYCYNKITGCIFTFTRHISSPCPSSSVYFPYQIIIRIYEKKFIKPSLPYFSSISLAFDIALRGA
nr:MAG TPA: hypothetical protein [Caudoviricetes sp.]